MNEELGVRGEELPPAGGTGERAVDSRFTVGRQIAAPTSKILNRTGPYNGGTGDGGTAGARTDSQTRGAQHQKTEPRRPTKKRMVSKGRMARRLVYYCVGVLSVTALWAAAVVTVAVWRDTVVDLSAILTFIGGAFGGELLLLLLKRVLAKPNSSEE